MTKLEVIDYILNSDIKSLDNRLENLMNQDRITAGARYYVYNPYKFYSLNQIHELIGKAAASKNYTRSLKRIDSIQYSVWLQMFKEDLKKTTDFIEEQENLPFEQSQKQILIQNGEI